jgi:hypothetical protein
MVDKKLRIVVTGLIAQYPLGGVAWDYGQYASGLHRLGHDVYYFEDTGQWPYNPLEGGVSKGCDYNVDYLSRVLTQLGWRIGGRIVSLSSRVGTASPMSRGAGSSRLPMSSSTSRAASLGQVSIAGSLG